MKKLLSFLGAIGLVATSSATVVACGPDSTNSSTTGENDLSTLSQDDFKSVVGGLTGDKAFDKVLYTIEGKLFVKDKGIHENDINVTVKQGSKDAVDLNDSKITIAEGDVITVNPSSESVLVGTVTFTVAAAPIDLSTIIHGNKEGDETTFIVSSVSVSDIDKIESELKEIVKGETNKISDNDWNSIYVDVYTGQSGDLETCKFTSGNSNKFTTPKGGLTFNLELRQDSTN
jgi:hypothetical protein